MATPAKKRPYNTKYRKALMKIEAYTRVYFNDTKLMGINAIAKKALDKPE